MDETMPAARVPVEAGASAAPAADEEVSHLPGRPDEPTLLVRHAPGPGPGVLYVHGATFPSALSIAWRIDGRSWMDDLRGRGFDVWAFDFAGYGGSEKPAMPSDGSATDLPGRASDAAAQIERVASYVRMRTARERLSIVAHSWGTIPAGLFAGRRCEWVERLVLFGPVARRAGGARTSVPARAGYDVSAEEQRLSFVAGLPAGQAPLFVPALFRTWVQAYLATDPDSATRSPPAVRVPGGWQADFADAWSGRLPYDPATVRSPTLIVRGEWDDIAGAADAAWLVDALSNVPGGARDVLLPRGGHRMHLEANRQSLFDAVAAFLP